MSVKCRNCGGRWSDEPWGRCCEKPELGLYVASGFATVPNPHHVMVDRRDEIEALGREINQAELAQRRADQAKREGN